MKYRSLQKHYRNFCFQRDYDSKDDFNEDMKKDYEDGSEICWAFLFSDAGTLVAEYRRGFTMAEYFTEQAK